MSIRTFLLVGIITTLGAGIANAQEYGPTGAPASWKHPVNDAKSITFFQVDRAEFRQGQGTSSYVWDTQGWIGNDTNKLWVKAEGEGEFGGRIENAQLQALYSRMVTPFFNFQTGIRQDVGPDILPTTYAVVGMQGLAPYWFEVDSALFLSEDGDITARVEAEYDMRFTQRLIGQPRIEVNLAAQNVQKLGTGSGLSTIEIGYRLRYEFKREVAPYIGVAWEQAVGNTADFRRLAGNKASSTSFVAGIRLWF